MKTTIRNRGLASRLIYLWATRALQNGSSMSYGVFIRIASGYARLGRTIPIFMVMACVLVARAAAQQAPLTLSSNDIMGFESLGAWNVTGSSSSPGFVIASTTNRTQGSAAFSVANPPNLTKLVSQPVASTAT